MSIAWETSVVNPNERIFLTPRFLLSASAVRTVWEGPFVHVARGTAVGTAVTEGRLRLSFQRPPSVTFRITSFAAAINFGPTPRPVAFVATQTAMPRAGTTTQ